MTNQFRVTIYAIAAASLLLLAGDSASAASIGCGAKLTRDTTLEHDLVDCPDNGLVIGRDGITIDLAGHTLDGDGELRKDCPKRQICDDGIVSEGHSDFTVTNGAVKQFALGMLVVDAEHVAIKRMRALHNMFSGITLGAVSRTSLSRSALSRNGLETDQAGLSLFDSKQLRVTRATFRSNGDIGIFADGVSNSLIAGNRLLSNPEAGMILDGDHNVVAHNRVDRNGDGLVGGGIGTRIRHNRVTRSIGCDGGCGYGISTESGHGSVISDNHVSGSDNSNIRVGYGKVTNTTVSGNVVRDAGGWGIEVVAKSRHTQLLGNRASGSGRDGIRVFTASAVLGRNIADGNHDLGIKASVGVTDAGGNIASGNGNSRQCTGVFCA
jgi:large repetitive protein